MCRFALAVVVIENGSCQSLSCRWVPCLPRCRLVHAACVGLVIMCRFAIAVVVIENGSCQSLSCRWAPCLARCRFVHAACVGLVIKCHRGIRVLVYIVFVLSSVAAIIGGKFGSISLSTQWLVTRLPPRDIMQILPFNPSSPSTLDDT